MKSLLLTCAALICSGVLMAQKAPQLRADNIEEVLKAMTLEGKANLVVGAAGTTKPIPRLGIPAIVLADGPAGVRINTQRQFDHHYYYATHFPIGTSLSSTWNLQLVQQVGNAMGEEDRDYGVEVQLAPALGLMRNPLCGRNFEYYSEDPVLSGNIAAAYVKGVQDLGIGRHNAWEMMCALAKEPHVNSISRISKSALKRRSLGPLCQAITW